MRQGPPSAQPASPQQPLPAHTYRVLLADVAHELHEAQGDALLIQGFPLGDTRPLPSWVVPLLVGRFLTLQQATGQSRSEFRALALGWQSQRHDGRREAGRRDPAETGLPACQQLAGGDGEGEGSWHGAHTSGKDTQRRWAEVSERNSTDTGQGAGRLLACTRNAAHPQQGAQGFLLLSGHCPAYTQGWS